MCSYCTPYPYWAYPTYPLYQYPATYASYLPYGIPLGYAYAPLATAEVVAPPAYFSAVPAVARGEHKVGNCLMICQ